MPVLFPLLTIYTTIYAGLMLYDFVMQDAFAMPAGLMVVYMTLLGGYVADKEVKRWMGRTPRPRLGSLFIYVWLLLYLGAFVTNSFAPQFALPEDLQQVVLQVLAVFFGTKASKQWYAQRTERATDTTAAAPDDSTLTNTSSTHEPAPTSTEHTTATQQSHTDRIAAREKAILALFATQERVTRAEVEALLHVSDSTAHRTLEALEARGAISQRGHGRAVHYVRTSS